LPMNVDDRRYSEGHDIPTGAKVTDIEFVVSNGIGICPSSAHLFCLNKAALSIKQRPMEHTRPQVALLELGKRFSKEATFNNNSCKENKLLP